VGRPISLSRGLGEPQWQRLHAFVDGRDALRGRLQPVLHQQVQVVPLVQDPDVDLGVQLLQAAGLAVLLRDQLLVQRGDLDEEVIGRQIEVGRERLGRPALAVPLEDEGPRLVVPDDPVEVEELGELQLGIVREADCGVRQRVVTRRRSGASLLAQGD
jgi:hypothetical protein